MDVYSTAKWIVQKLAQAGHTAYFAGGWVRDFVMGHPSEDIDIATSASPAEVMELFSHTIPVGLAFGIVIVVQQGHQFEMATFRRDLKYVDGRHPEGIELATPEEDALRRDFTINGMFYDPLTEVVHDYVQGKADIQRGVIRTIGDPHERFFEDRLRMLRAFRFSARFGFYIEPETQAAIQEHVDRFFPSVAMERVWQEFNKMASYPRFDQALVEMHRLGLLEIIFPEMQGWHVHNLRQQVASFHRFPPNSPTILYLMELFPDFNLQAKLEIAKRLKSSHKDLKLIEYQNQFEQAVREGSEDWGWAHLMAHPHYALCLGVTAAREGSPEVFLEQYGRLYTRLHAHIVRLQQKTPLITASMLKEQGIPPGKRMGQLLLAAEKLAINQDLHDPTQLLHQLAIHSLWRG